MTTIEVTEEQAKLARHALREYNYDKTYRETHREYWHEYGKASREALRGRDRVVSALDKVEPFESPFGEWITGFWMGDGYVNTPQGYVDFGQKEPQILQYICAAMGRDETGLHLRTTNFGSVWILTIGKTEEVARLVKTFITHVSCPLRLEQIKPFGAAVLHKSTKYTFSGFWDAEGTSALTNRKYAIEIQAFQRDKRVLDSMVLLWPSSRVDFDPRLDVYVLVLTGSVAWEAGLWLLRTSHNNKKRKVLHERMYVIQEYRKMLGLGEQSGRFGRRARCRPIENS